MSEPKPSASAGVPPPVPEPNTDKLRAEMRAGLPASMLASMEASLPHQPSRAEAREVRHVAKRAVILAAARTLVHEKGYESTSLRAIAKAAGHSPAALYEYFDGKEAILTALSQQAGAHLRQHLDAAMAGSSMAADMLVRLGLAYVEYARGHAEDFLLLFSRAAGPVPDLHDQDEAAPLRPLVDAARCGLASGEFDPLFEAEELAWGIWALAHGMAMLQLTVSGGGAVDHGIDDTYALRAHVAGLSI